MDQNSDYVTIFKSHLKHDNLRKPHAIYDENTENVSSKSYSERQYTSRDVISIVSKQIRALQRADTNINSNFKKPFRKDGVSEPVHLLSLHCNNPLRTSQNVNKFETQDVSDTQLIQIVEDVENLLAPIGMTEEFETSFCEKHISRKQLTDNTCNNFKEENNGTSNCSNRETITTESFHQNDFISEQNVSLVKINKKEEKELTDFDNDIDVLQDSIRSNPTTNNNQSLTPDCHSPFICTNEAFEIFETIAFPIVNKNTDIEVVKQLINTGINRKILDSCPPTKLVPNKNQYSTKINNVQLETKRKFISKGTVVKNGELFSCDSSSKGTDICILEEDVGKNCNVNEKCLNNTGVHLLKSKPNSCSEPGTIPSEISDMMQVDTKRNKDSIFTLKQNCIDTDYDNPVYGPVLQDINRNFITKENNDMSPAYNNEPLRFDKFPRTDFMGFKTANNKQITISEQALGRTKNVFKDCCKLDDFDDVVMENIETSGTNNVINAEIKTGQLTTNPIESYKFKTTYNKRETFTSAELVNTTKICFKTAEAGGKNMCISKKAIAMSRNDEEVCCDVEGKEFKSDKINKKVCKITSTSSTNNNLHVEIANDDSDLNKHKILAENNNLDNEVFIGFQTASNKKLKISDKALAKSKQVFKDLELTESNQLFNENENLYSDNPAVAKCNFANDCVQFFKEDFRRQDDYMKSASEKLVKNSEKALANSKNLCQDFDPIHVAHEQVKITQDISSSKNVDENMDPDGANDKLNYSTNNSMVSKNHSANDEISERKASTTNYGALDNSNAFMGFQTGSNKRVKVSNDALAKSKKLFQDFSLNIDFKQSPIVINDFEGKDSLPGDVSKTVNIINTKPNSNEDDLGFITANNDVEGTVSNNQNNNLHLDDLTENKLNLGNLIDTQVVNDFQEINTEDFCNKIEITRSKRSGSPILCPTAKRRKEFKVPYRIDQKRITETKNIVLKEDKSIKFSFNENYKKIKKLSLSDLKNMNKVNKEVFEVDSYILSFKYENMLDFEFSNERNELSKDTWGTEDLKIFFLTLVEKRIIPDGWLENHLKLIMSKLIYYESEFKHVMRGVCSVRNVLEQLKYRYDKELYNAERSAFRKILEKDDVPTKTMVLRVIAMYVDGVAVSRTTETDNVEVLLTDGWYCIKACLDPMLKKLVCCGKIKTWTKLVTHGAELLNCEQGVAPWEDTSSVRLKLFGNSTRRARWNARLGYHSTAAILTPLSFVQLSGGKVSKLRVFVTRVYPIQYVEKLEDGSTITRSERLENIYQMKYESEKQTLLEKLYEEVEKEFIDKESQHESENDVGKVLDSGSQISRLMKKSRDTEEFIENLTNTQFLMLQDYTSKRRENLQQSMQTRLVEKLKARGLHHGRNVVPVLKTRIVDINEHGEITRAMMSIWRTNEMVSDVVKEGIWIEVFNIAPTAFRYSEIQLSAGTRTVFKPYKCKEIENINCITSGLARTCYSIKELVQNQSEDALYNEVDTVGLVFLIYPSNDRFELVKGPPFQNVYLTDAEKNLICVNFWGGLRKYGYENVLTMGQVIAAINLQKRTGYTRKNVAQFRATEFSYFTKLSKLASVRKLADDLNRALICVDIKKFCEECEAMVNDSIIKSNVEDISPYRIDYSAYDVSKHKGFLNSPVTRKSNQVDIQNTSLSISSRKNTINAQIEKIKMCGKPPPLNHIYIVNKSKNVTNAYKSPLSTRNSDNAAIKQLKENVICVNNASCSVITNHNSNENGKFAKPVKINFCRAPRDENNVINIDHFEEEFDASLPMSLD